ncbi:methyltransferase [Sorangium cellulosum]|uniref:Methyltransferase n=1 Tax=Sorangium cellulosum TaxID=56 RepID=A0A4V0NEW5_SORCE|nr:methyltransferase domain-containing protein [Sorangium cellulosum]AUX27592.1 methyltransferase [Sorangium cellulosum]
MTSERPRNPLAAPALEGGASGAPDAPAPGEAGSAAAKAPQGEQGPPPARSFVPRPDRAPSVRPPLATTTPLPRLDAIPGVAGGGAAGQGSEIPDLDLDPRIAGPPTERSRPATPLPSPAARRTWQSLATEMERTAEVERDEGAKASRRRSRRLVNEQGDAPPQGGDEVAPGGLGAGSPSVAPRSSEASALQDVDDDGWLSAAAKAPAAPAAEEPRQASRPAPAPNAAELVAPRAVPRPSPKPSSIPPVPAPAPGGFIVDPDSVAVIRPLQIVSIESNLPPVASLSEPAKPPLLTEPSEHDWPPPQFRIKSDDRTTKLGLEAFQDGVLDGPPTARDTAVDADPAGPRGSRGEALTSAPTIELGGSMAWSASSADDLAEVEPEPESTDERAELQGASRRGDEGGAGEQGQADPTRSTLPPRSGDIELEEVEPERDGDGADEVAAAPADAAAHPKKPPPPPPLPPRRAQALASPDLATFTSSVPPPPTSVPPPQGESLSAVRPATPPASPAAAPAAAAPAAKPAEIDSTSGPSTEPAVRRKRPWWEELFGDDFLRTLDKLDPKVVRREVDFIEERLGVEKGAVILDLACGAGGHAIEIASRGYSVVGFDLSLAMLARAADDAQDRGQKLNFLQGDMREMTFEETFDGVYCWSTSFGYFDDEKNADVLARIRRALRSGGMLLLDIVNRDYVASRQPSLVWFEGDGCVCMDEMQVDFFTSRLKVKRTVMFEDGRSREIDYSIRLYGLHELGKLLHDAGFKVTEVTGHPAHPGVFFGSESPRLIILAERS